MIIIVIAIIIIIIVMMMMVIIIIIIIIIIIRIALFILGRKQYKLKFTSKTWLKYHINTK